MRNLAITFLFFLAVTYAIDDPFLASKSNSMSNVMDMSDSYHFYDYNNNDDDDIYNSYYADYYNREVSESQFKGEEKPDCGCDKSKTSKPKISIPKIPIIPIISLIPKIKLPTPKIEEPCATPVKPTPVPVKPTPPVTPPKIEEPCATPVKPTPVPVKPTPPVTPPKIEEPCATPVKPTPVPVKPTPPVTPPKTEVPCITPTKSQDTNSKPVSPLLKLIGLIQKPGHKMYRLSNFIQQKISRSKH